MRQLGLAPLPTPPPPLADKTSPDSVPEGCLYPPMDWHQPQVDAQAMAAFALDTEPPFRGRDIARSIQAELGARGRLLLLVVGGSHAYGTATPTSDVDYRGAFAHGKANLMGLESLEDGINRTEPEDIQIDSLRKLLNLGLQGKFSVAEMLFVPKECVLYREIGRAHV